MSRIIQGTVLIPEYVTQYNGDTPTGFYTFTDAVFNSQLGFIPSDIKIGFVLYAPAYDLSSGRPLPGVAHRYVVTEITPDDTTGMLSATVKWDESDAYGYLQDGPINSVYASISEASSNYKFGLPVSDAIYPELMSGISTIATDIELKGKVDIVGTDWSIITNHPTDFIGYGLEPTTSDIPEGSNLYWTAERASDLLTNATSASSDTISSAIAAEVSSRDAAIADAVAAEAALREASDAAEATSRDAAISSAVAVETSARIAAINTEVSSRDAAISSAVAAEATSRDAAISSAVAVETSARIAAINTEVSSRDAAISSAVAVETSARIAAINTEVSSRDAAISSAVAVETSARIAAINTEVSSRDAAISSAVAAEATSRDAAIADAVATEASARESAIAAAIAIEQSAREAADRALLGGLRYLGTWDASTNTPPIPEASEENKGGYYINTQPGSTNINGITDWQPTDWVVSDGVAGWVKIDNSDKVTSVNGKVGEVNLSTDDILEGSSKYFTEEKVLNTTLSNLVSVSGNVTSEDSLLSAIGKLVASTKDSSAPISYFVATSRYAAVSTIGQQVWIHSSSKAFGNLAWTQVGSTLTILHPNHGRSVGDMVIIRNTSLDYLATLVTSVTPDTYSVAASNSITASGTQASYSLGFTYAHNAPAGSITGGALTAPANGNVQLISMRFNFGSSVRSGTTYAITLPPNGAINGAGSNTSHSDLFLPILDVRQSVDTLGVIAATIYTNQNSQGYNVFTLNALGATASHIALQF